MKLGEVKHAIETVHFILLLVFRKLHFTLDSLVASYVNSGCKQFSLVVDPHRIHTNDPGGAYVIQ